MKTNKPRVVCHEVKAVGAPVTLKFIVREDVADEYMSTLSESHPVVSSSPLIRISDYEALQAECESLRKDAERYRWIRLQVGVQLTGSQAYPASPYLLASPPAGESVAESTDSAIDAAMEATK